MRRRAMYFATVETAMWIPSFASSLRMRGAPQVTFAFDILRIKLTPRDSIPASEASGPASPCPEALEPFSMPPDHRRGLNDRQALPPACPHLREDHPEASVQHAEGQAPASAGPNQRRDLLTERKVLESELALGSK